MKLLTTAGRIHGLPVVTLSGGDDVAEVRDVVYNPDSGRLVGLTLNKRGYFAGRHRDVLPIDSVHAIGRDAVMIADESSLTAPENAPDDIGRPPSERDVLGDDVITESGVSLGKVTDLVLLVGGRGEVVGYQMDKPDGGQVYIPLPAQISVSGTALVVPDLTENFAREDLVGLGAAVEEYRSQLGLP